MIVGIRAKSRRSNCLCPFTAVSCPIIVTPHMQKRYYASPPLPTLYLLLPEREEYYLISTTAPTSSSFCLIDAASSFDIACFTGFGASSTRAFASFSPKPVIARTSLITWIFLSPELVRITSNSVCSAGASATAPVAAVGIIAMGAAAVTPNFSSSSFTKTESSSTVMFSIKPSTSSFVIATAFFSYGKCLPPNDQLALLADLLFGILYRL